MLGSPAERQGKRWRGAESSALRHASPEKLRLSTSCDIMHPPTTLGPIASIERRRTMFSELLLLCLLIQTEEDKA